MRQTRPASEADKPKGKVATLGRFVPGMDALRTYQPAWLSKDIVAGLVLASLLVPQGMAYAELAGLPPITGLYTSVLCLIAYAIFGRLSEEIFYTERTFEPGGLRYPFLTGSARHGHVGALVFAGPHAADFADRFRQRVTGCVRFHA